MDDKVLHPDRINEALKNAKYAVRGELYLRATELQEEGKEVRTLQGASSRDGGEVEINMLAAAISEITVTRRYCEYRTSTEVQVRRCSNIRFPQIEF